MSKQQPLLAITALSVSLGVFACAANNDFKAGGSGNRCNPTAAQTLVGQSDVSDDEAKSITGAVTIRRISPGDMVTQDFRGDRLTLEVDGRAVVLRAICG